MLLYGALLSPFVRKVALFAREKGMDYDIHMAGPGSPDPEFLAASPFGKIPAIRDGDVLLADSSAIAHYLEAKHPTPALIPADPVLRGRAVWFDEFADTIFAASGLKILFNRLVGPKLLKLPHDETLAVQGEAELPRIYAYLESVTPAEGWLLGETFSLADISVAAVLASLEYVDVDPAPATYPAIRAWYDRVRARPAWQAVAEEEAPTRARISAIKAA